MSSVRDATSTDAGTVSSAMATSQGKARPSRKQDILDVFAQMVAERGYDAVSIRDVAELMKISKGTVIHHYGSKDRMLEQVHFNYMRRRLREAHLMIERLETPREQLASIVVQNFFALRDDHDATVAFAREIVRFASEDIMGEVRVMRREYSQILRDVLSRGMADGSFRREDPVITSLQIFGMFNWSWTWLRTEGPWRMEELASAFVRNILSGIDAGASIVEGATDVVVDVVRQVMAEVGEEA
jgi:AcrR family transcriptional regulator